MAKKPGTLNLFPKKGHCNAISIFGFCLGLCGLLCCVFWDVIFNCILDKAITLRPNSKLFELWKTPPLKLNLDFYLYNWTNPEDFHDHSIKPILQEIGPYSFIEKPDKAGISWHPENDTVSYRRKSTFYFDAERSVGRLDDQITTINSLAVAAGSKAKRWGAMRRTLIDIALKVYNDDLAMTKSARELLFDGYDDVLLDVLAVIPTTLSDIYIPFDKFGYCYMRNGSSDFYGVFNVHTGADDIRKLGKLHSWNYKSKTNYFPEGCSRVKGSAGEFQTPYLKAGDPVEFFATDFCRSLALDYAGPASIEGVPGLKYFGGPRSMDNGTLYPENACYCNGECVPSGAINISSCWYDAAMFMSYPHFHNADPYYLQQVEGLQPIKEKHETYIVLQPRTGFALELAARFQVNTLVEPLPYLSMFRHVRKIYFPLFWFEEKTTLTPDLTGELKLLPIAEWGGKIFGALCFTVGLLLIVWQPILRHWQRRFIRHIEINDLEENTQCGTKADILATVPETSDNTSQASEQLLSKSDSTRSTDDTSSDTVSLSSTDKSCGCTPTPSS